ncbi:fibronectin type III domain-containing protein, partial [Patescibacteria group bacterium AH-259-L07]|nr:fibronectin type III domain-containing protein [Patescibacteria group bacterium AH-259-L07]
ASAETPPTAPDNFSADVNHILKDTYEIQLSWNDTSSLEDGFYIYQEITLSADERLWNRIGTVGANTEIYKPATFTTGETYKYMVKAYNTGGESSMAGPDSATVPPAMPPNFSASTQSISEIKLTWDDVSGETRYELKKSTNAGGCAGNWGNCATETLFSGTTSYSSTALSSNTTYYYALKACNAGGCSAQWTEASATTWVCTPDEKDTQNCPIIEEFVVSSIFTRTCSADGTWGSCTLSCQTGWGDCTAEYGCETNIYTDVNNCGVDSTTACGNVCTAPTNTTASCSTGSCGWSCKSGWGNCNGDASDGCETNTNTDVNNCGTCGKACSSAPLDAYDVCSSGSCDWKCNGGFSPVGASCVMDAPTQSPETFKATASSKTSILLEWSSVIDATSYKIEWSLDAQELQRIGGGSSLVETSDTFYTHRGLSSGTTYYYRLFACTAGGCSGLWSDASATTWVCEPGTKDTQELPAIEFGATTTEERTCLPNGTWGAWGGGTLSCDEGYHPSSDGTSCIIDAPAAPAVPEGLEATATGSTTIKVEWNTMSGEESFQLNYVYSGGGTTITGIAKDSILYNHTGLQKAETYTYKIRACNSSGCSNWSGTASATTLYPPVAPSNLRVTGTTSSSISLAWDDNSNNEKGFIVRRKKGSGSWGNIILEGANRTSYSDTGLSSSTTYTYKVRAYNDGGDSGYSNTVSATTKSTRRSRWFKFI